MLQRIFSLLVLSCMVVACTGVRPAPDFNEELNKQYQTLATAETEPFYDWTDAAYYKDKGKRALEGRVVLPEDPETWKVPAEYLPEMNKGYDALQIALNVDKKKATHPIPAAQAQASFDCWVEQAQEKWTPQTYQQCRRQFYDAMCRMYEGDCTLVDRIYRVFFATNSTTIDAEGRKAIDSVVKAYVKNGKDVIVVGHADRVGTNDYNLALSKRRAETVKVALKRGGVSGARVEEKYFGEEQPLVPTKDNVPNRSNRRVLIVVR